MTSTFSPEKKPQRVIYKLLFSHIFLEHCQFSWLLKSNFYSTHTFCFVVYYDCEAAESV